MLKLHYHFSIKLMSVLFIAILSSLIVSFFALKNMQLDAVEKQLQLELKLISIQIQYLKNVNDITEFINKIKDSNNYRITVIKNNGIVIADTNKNASTMDNHALRPEILDAKERQFGTNIRYSDTVNANFLYTATEVEFNNEIMFLRLSVELDTINKDFFSVWLKIIILFAVAFIIIVLISFSIGTKIKKEVNKILHGLKMISEKSYNTRINSGFAQEFVSISNMIHNLSDKLSKKDKQKRKYTAKFRLISKQRSDVISAIGHEIKNPIATIIGYAQSICEDEKMNTEIRNKFLNKIVSNANKISLMLDKLTLSAKLENKDLIPNKTQFNLGSMVEDVILQHSLRLPDRKITANIYPCIVYADSTMMEMVVDNLLSNALKYSEEEIIVEVDNNQCSVVDFGKGVSEEEISQITKKFYRSNRFSWDNSMGLGLFIVEYMLKLNNSKLEIVSKIGEGSTFSFKLPSK